MNEYERILHAIAANRLDGLALSECAFNAVVDLLHELARRERELLEAAERSVGG